MRVGVLKGRGRVDPIKMDRRLALGARLAPPVNSKVIDQKGSRSGSWWAQETTLRFCL